MFETRPIGAGREDNAEDVSQRNWTTEQALPAPATFRKVPVLGHTATNPVPILFLHPFAENPKRNYGFLGDPPHFQSGGSAGTQAPAPTPSPARDTTSGCGLAPPGVGLQHHPGPAICEVTRFRGLQGHLCPRTRPSCGRSPPRPSAELQLLARDPAKLLRAFQSFPTLETCPVREFSPSRTPPGRDFQAGDAETPSRFSRTNPILSQPLPSASTPAPLRAPILQPWSPEVRRIEPFWWDVTCNHLTQHQERKQRGKEKIKKKKSATLTTTGVQRPAGGMGGAAAACLPLVLSSTTRILKQ